MEYDTITVKLKRGLLLDGKPQTEAVLRESTVRDTLEARKASDDPVIAGAEMIRRQILRIGEIELINDDAFGNLTTTDLEILEKASSELEDRGREFAGA